jgi:hypothetical protein
VACYATGLGYAGVSCFSDLAGCSAGLVDWLCSVPSWPAMWRCTHGCQCHTWFGHCACDQPGASRISAWLHCHDAAGSGGNGRLGNGGTAQQNAPVAVSGSYSFTVLATGTSHTCGLLGDRTALCWGESVSWPGLCAGLVDWDVSVTSSWPVLRCCWCTNAMLWSATACPQAVMHRLCGCCVVQAMVFLGSWATAALLNKPPQWRCLAHSALLS